MNYFEESFTVGLWYINNKSSRIAKPSLKMADMFLDNDASGPGGRIVRMFFKCFFNQ